MKPIKVEDLKVGDDIVLMSSVDPNGASQRGVDYGGTILRVLAVDAPFVVVMEVKWQESRYPVDTRRYEIAIPSREYVEALTSKSSDNVEVSYKRKK